MNANIISLTEQTGRIYVPLLHKQRSDQEHYALLNGSSNNVCVDANNVEQSEWYRRMAWSSGNNTYLSFGNGQCFIYRYNTPKVESFDERLVIDNAEKFFKYLSKAVTGPENHIVPYVLRTYRALRNEMRTADSGLDSLKALLYLLAYSRDKDNINFDDWGLEPDCRDVVASIDHGKWEMILDQFEKGICFADKWLVPNIDLILRHTAGRLFEEANYIAYLPPQLTLFPNEKIKYSYYTLQDGAYFTPSYVARTIVEETLRRISLNDKDSLTIFDPACGASGFLVEALRQLKKAGYNKPVHVIGWDKAETAVMMSRFVLSFEQQEWDNKQMDFEIKLCDSLSVENWPKNVDLLLMNPPFLSWNRMTRTPNLREEVQLILPNIPRPNLSAAFVAKAILSLGNSGVFGAVVPTHLLNDENYRPLRQMIMERMHLELLGNLGSYIFETVMAYTSMIVATRNRDNIDQTTILWSKNIKGAAEMGLKALRKHQYTNAVLAAKDFSVYETKFDANRKTWKIDNYNNLMLKGKLDAAVLLGRMRRVSELFDIRLGARTGANDVFIVPEETVKNLPENERHFFRPSTDNMSIDSGHLYHVNYVFYPYTKGLRLIESEDVLQQTLPETYEKILLPAKMRLENRNSLRGNPRWWELSEHRAWQEEMKTKLVSTEFGNAGSFAIDYSGEYVVERGNMWELRSAKIHPQIQMKFYEAYLAFFCSSYMDELLELYGEPLAGDEVYKLGKAYVKDIPLPDLSRPLFNKFIPKLRYFSTLMKADEYWSIDELDSLVKEIMNNVE